MCGPSARRVPAAATAGGLPRYPRYCSSYRRPHRRGRVRRLPCHDSRVRRPVRTAEEPVMIPLQPLRIPPGWRVFRNNFLEEDPSDYFAPDSPARHTTGGSSCYFGGCVLFMATNPDRRRAVELEWRTQPEQPTVGRYVLRLLQMVEGEPVGDGLPPEVGPTWEIDDPRSESESRAEIVAVLEEWLWSVATSTNDALRSAAWTSAQGILRADPDDSSPPSAAGSGDPKSSA